MVKERRRLLRGKHINRRKQHVLKSRKHLNYSRELQSKYVLVPADKAANNVIVVCKKYYLEVVIRELTTTSTYDRVDRECMHVHVVAEHLRFMTNYKIRMEPELRYLLGYQRCINSRMVQDLLLPLINVVRSLCQSCLLHA